MTTHEDQAYGTARQSKIDMMTDEEFALLMDIKMDIKMDAQLRLLETMNAAKEVRDNEDVWATT